MSNEVDEIKARVDIVDLISEYIRLKQAGTNNWKALCPFHNEKTPSFMVSRDKQIWHCFGCAEGGDIFTFIQKMEGMEFPEALRLLAQKAGVKLTPQNPQLASQKNRLMDIIQLAAKFWHQTLLDSESARKARDYLAKREVSDKIIADFKIGYAVDSWDSLIKFLQGKGFTDQEIFLAGLSVKKERGQDFYDRFRDRLMFPINDLHSSPIGFTGRTLQETSDSSTSLGAGKRPVSAPASAGRQVTRDKQPAAKYINTPQTLIYNKSLVIFNLDKARQEIKTQDLAIIVEGQMDVLAAVQAGTENVIASSGTALTLDQIKILKRYSNNIAIAFDTDLAGESAAKRGIDLVLSQEMNVKIIVLPEGKDPDECIKKNPDDWFKAIKQAKSIMEYYFEKTLGRLDLNKVDDKKEAAKILLPIITKIGNKIEQAHWLQKLAELLKVSEQVLREALPKSRASRPADQPKAVVQIAKDRNKMLAEQILAIILKYPVHIPYSIDNLSAEVVIDRELNSLYKKLIIYYTEDIASNIDSFDYQEFQPQLKKDNLTEVADKLVLLAEKDFFDFDSEVIRDELIKTVNFLKKHYYNTRLKEVGEEIKQAESADQQDKVRELIEQFNEIVAQLNLLD